MLKSQSIYYLLFLLVCSYFNSIKATYQEPYDFSTESDLVYFSEFGFLENGAYTLHIEITSILDNTTYPTSVAPPFQVYGCFGKEFSKNIRFNDVCVWNPKCTITYLLRPGNNYFYGNIKKEGYYYFLMSNCANQKVDFTVEYKFTNPVDNQLSYELMPLPIILMVFVGLWTILLVLWIFNWAKNRSQNIKLHRVISLYPISKLIDVIYSLGYYQFFKVHGYTSTATVIMYWVIFIIFRIISIVVLMLIAAGWSILPIPISQSYQRTINMAVVLLTITLGLGSFLGGYYNILSFIIYIPVLIVIFLKTDKSIRAIQISIASTIKRQQQQQQQVEQGEEQNNVDQPPQQQQQVQYPKSDVDNISLEKRYSILYMYIAFKWIMIIFLGLTIILQFLAVVFTYTWVFDLFTYLIEISLFICLALTFRLRKEKKVSYFLFEEDYELNTVNNEARLNA